MYDTAQKEELGVADRLLAALKAQARFYRDNQDVVKIYISERSNIDSVSMPHLNERVNRLHERMVQLFEHLFERGIQDGVFKPYPPGKWRSCLPISRIPPAGPACSGMKIQTRPTSGCP